VSATQNYSSNVKIEGRNFLHLNYFKNDFVCGRHRFREDNAPASTSRARTEPFECGKAGVDEAKLFFSVSDAKEARVFSLAIFFTLS
jgi:hypothetical protein